MDWNVVGNITIGMDMEKTFNNENKYYIHHETLSSDAFKEGNKANESKNWLPFFQSIKSSFFKTYLLTGISSLKVRFGSDLVGAVLTWSGIFQVHQESLWE